jgi:tRNA(Ile)-lysidine synthase
MGDDPPRGVTGGGERDEAGSRLSAAVRGALARHGLLEHGDHVLVGVSGGPDSVALLHALTLLRTEHALRLTVCHVHHGLRPEADRDAVFVEALAARLGCPAHIVRVEVPRGSGRSPEEAARLVRHAALARVARTIGARRIALGHTADDQAETVLMRVLQGAGPRGLAGIPARRGRIVRPLLAVDRAAVLDHLAAYALEAVEDATNRDPKFLRNRVRHELLPLLAAQAGPRVPEALRRVARGARETVEALDALVRPRVARHLSATPVGWRLALAPLHGLPPGAVKAAIRVALVEVAAPDRLGSGLRAPHLDALDALTRAATGARVRLPAGIVVERGRDALWVLRSEARCGVTPLAVPGAVTLGPMLSVTATLEAISDRAVDAPGEAWFDAEALGLAPGAGIVPPPGLVVRPRRPRERMVPFGGRAAIRLGRLLASAGVPRLARARWPVVARPDGEVLWIVGVRRAAAAPLGPGTRTMLRLEAAAGSAGPPAA